MKNSTLINQLRWGLMLLILLVSLKIEAQKFYLADSIEIHTNLKIGYFEQIHSKDLLAYYWFPLSYYGNDSLTFFTFSDKKAGVKWYKIPSPFKNIDISSCSSMAINGNKLLVLGPYKFYIFKKENDNYRLIKSVKLKNHGRFWKIYFIDSNTVLLAGTYDYANRKTLWSDYNFCWYDIRKNKYVHHQSLDVGRGIAFCYYPLQTIAYNEDYFAVSYITKPTVLLYSKKHQLIREIKLNKFSLNTDSVLAQYLPNNLLKEYRFHPKNKIEIINKHKLYQYPSLKRISFINKDTLMIIVNTSFNSFNYNRKIYLYSIKQDSVLSSFFVSKDDKNIPRTFFLTSGLIQFNNNFISFIKTVFNEDNEQIDYKLLLYKYKDIPYFANVPKITSVKHNTLDNKKDTVLAMTTQNIIKFSYDYKGNRPNESLIDNYHSVIWIDQYFCSSCYRGYKNEKVLIIIDNDIRMGVTLRFTKQEYYKSLFPKSVVLFLKDGYSFDKKLINKVIQLKENKK